MHKYGANRLLVVGAQTQSNAKPNLLSGQIFQRIQEKADFGQEMGERGHLFPFI